MKLRFFVTAVFAAACAVGVAQAQDVAYFSDELSSADSTQLGRPSRNGDPQTWLGQESYPGQINTANTYYFTTYSFAASDFTGAPYVDISVDDVNASGDFFVSAYANSYDPSTPSANWLGDMGDDSNYFGTDPLDFDVILPVGDSLLLMVNSTAGGTNGLDQPYDIAINAYSDTEYDPPVPAAATPEPGTLIMTLTGVLGAGGMVRRKRFARC